jgi:hypothetical protein
MKKIIIGSIQYAAERAFIPLIEEVAETGGDSGVFVAHLISVVVLEREGIWVYSFKGDQCLTDLLATIPELGPTIEKARQSL